ncbi:MAG: tetratricopeptide repeat protein, partial [Myxococcales bacterium]|nr:tetratricopeptide repeat protein [Myxococcales bacterium]
DEAIPLIERSLAIEEATRGPTHPELIYGLNNLAEVLIAAGRPAEAAPYLARGQAIIDERDLKATSQGVLILSSRAALARALGHAAEALALREEACAVAEGLYGGAHPVVGECLGNLAGLRLDQGDLAGAAAALERGRAILADEREHHHNLLALQMIEASLRWAEPGRRAEARALVDAVAAEVEKAAATEGDKPEFRALRRQIKAWRADHPA